MTALTALTRRNCKLFFRDKAMFFTALITPAILLVLYASFLANVYRDTFLSAIPAGIAVSDDLMGGLVGGQLVSSILAVSCVTVSFCANVPMILDRVTGARRDLTVSPVRPSTLALSYCLGTAIVSLIVCFVAMGLGLAYLAITGWYLSVSDILLTALDVVLLVLFGTALSSAIFYFLSTQGQMSAVGTIVSAGYGFLCGAYMPISQFGLGLQRVLLFLPGTYGTSLLRNHLLRGALSEFPAELADAMRDVLDCNLYFFDTPVSTGAMYLILAVAVALLIALNILLNARRRDPAMK